MQRLLTWLEANKDWLFEGAGILIVAALVKWIWSLHRRAQATPDPAEEARKRAAERETQNSRIEPTPGEVKLHTAPRVEPAEGRPLRYCSYCHRSDREVARMIIGASSNICSECHSKILDIFDEHPERATWVRNLVQLSYAAQDPETPAHLRESFTTKVHTLASLLRKRGSDCAGQVVGGYRLIERIGSGSFSIVWKAESATHKGNAQRPVALKIFDQNRLSDGLMLWRFQRGISAMSALSSLGPKTPKFIVRYLDVSDDRLSFAMEYLGQKDIANLRRRSLRESARLSIFLDVADAVAYAHDHHIVHRDIKPGNVLLRDDGTAALTDFDIADLKFASVQSVPTGGLGTPQFAAPEQITADETAEAEVTADIYSLGKLLYFLVTETAPVIGSTFPGSEQDFLASIPDSKIRHAIDLALRNDPSKRPSSVQELVGLAGIARPSLRSSAGVKLSGPGLDGDILLRDVSPDRKE